MKKIELHLHLEGAAPPSFIRGLAKEKWLDISGIFDAQGKYAFADFAHFLKVYEAATSVLKTPMDYHRLTLAVIEELAGQDIIYAETFLSPDFCGGGDVAGWSDFLEAIKEAAAEGESKFGVTLKGIATCVRHFGPDKAKRAAICAAETAGDFLVGYGMAGDETVLAPKDYAWGFDCAREAGLKLTAHAGEFAGPEAIRDTLRDLGVTRIGHGVRAIEDLALVDWLAERGVVLEICPGSNIALGLYRDYRAHPIRQLFHREVKVTVSTDDPPFFRTTLTREYEMLHRAFEWDEGVFATLNRTALDAAFCHADTKEMIVKKLES